MCRQKVTRLKLFIPAAAAAATPPLGPVLGQFGINTVQFCNEFNALTGPLSLFFEEGAEEVFDNFVLSVDIFVNEDRTCRFSINKPPVSFLLRALANVKKGAPHNVVGEIFLDEFVSLARFKFPNLSLPSAVRILHGTARSIGIIVVDR